jgi:epoxyqueuosine reductase QueG
MKEKIKDIFINLGSDICGIAGIDKFRDAPEGFHPTDIYSECKSVIVFAKALPKGIAKVNPRIIYQHFNSFAPVELDRIAYLAAVEIERDYGCTVVPIPADGPYDSWNTETLEGRGIISMKHAAVQAGLGTLGKNTLLINSKYGNMVTIGAVMTDLELTSDPPAEEICIKGCRLCLDNCPAGALDGHSANQMLCRTNTYENNARGFAVTNCNKCRVVCPRAFGLH